MCIRDRVCLVCGGDARPYYSVDSFPSDVKLEGQVYNSKSKELAENRRRECIMSTSNHSDSPGSQLDEVLEIIGRLARKSAGGDYIYRGEPECYEKVSSSLYRSLYRRYREIIDEDFDIEDGQIWILDEVRNYTTYTRETDELEILAQLQHYGGETNLIDFTTDYLIALFLSLIHI